MSYYADDIRRIAKQQENKPGIGSADSREPISGSTVPMIEITSDPDGGIRSPVTLEVLTWDPDADVTLSGGEIVKTAATAQITDANGTVILIDTIIYPPLTV